MADYNPNNNVWKKNPIWYLDNGRYPTSDLRKVSIGVRPDVWYNTVDGLKVGVNIERNYGLLNTTNAAAWYSTGVGGYGGNIEQMQEVQYQFDHSRKLNMGLNWNLQLRNKEGLAFYSTQLQKTHGHSIFTGRIKAMNRPFRYSSLYAPLANNWGSQCLEQQCAIRL